MTRKKKIVMWCIAGIIVNFIASGLMNTFAHAGKFDGHYFATFEGEIRHKGELVEVYQTDNNFTIKNGGLYYGNRADKDHRLGRIKYTGNTKATITIRYGGQGKVTVKIHKLQDGNFKGKGHGWYTGEDGLRYNLRETVYAEFVGQ